MNNQFILTLDQFIDTLRPVQSGSFRLIRHREPGLNLLDMYYANKKALEFYQSLQGRRVLECDTVFSFVGLPKSCALFIGAYNVISERGKYSRRRALPSPLAAPIEAREWLKTWRKHDKDCWHYNMRHCETYASLEMRLVIKWSVRSMTLTSLAQEVTEVRPTGAVEPCPDYEVIDVTLAKLAHIVNFSQSNPSWEQRLSAVGGIYLLTDHKNNRLYVGKTDSIQGFWGRWKAYAASKSGNVLVDSAFDDASLDPSRTTMSILTVIARGSAAEAKIQEAESRWKRRLLSRKTGYNAN